LHAIEANIYGCDLLFENYLVMLCFELDILVSTDKEKVLKRQLHCVKVLCDSVVKNFISEFAYKSQRIHKALHEYHKILPDLSDG